jgi:hypothetical protein
VKFIDEAVNFAYREFSHPAQQRAEIVGHRLMSRASWLRRGSGAFQFVDISANLCF